MDAELRFLGITVIHQDRMDSPAKGVRPWDVSRMGCRQGGLEAASHVFASAEPQTAAERLLSLASIQCHLDESQPWEEAP